MMVEYDGTNYHGSQRQSDLLTVQAVLEDTMNQVGLENSNLIFASRTDAGVHATGQVVNFLTKSQIPTENIPMVLNRRLPLDIRIKEARSVPMDFNCQRQAKNRTYIYNLYLAEDLPVFLRRYVYQAGYSLDLKLIKKALNCFIGEHDFTSFSCAGAEEGTFIRRVYDLKLSQKDLGVVFDSTNKKLIKIFIKANGFLHKMVRAMVGTLVDVGRKRLKPEAVREILEAKDRSLAAPFAPAHGLCLVAVEY